MKKIATMNDGIIRLGEFLKKDPETRKKELEEKWKSFEHLQRKGPEEEQDGIAIFTL